jgi:hypothetical protein
MSRYGKSLAQRPLVRIAPLEPVLWSRGTVPVIWTVSLAWRIRVWVLVVVSSGAGDGSS